MLDLISQSGPVRHVVEEALAQIRERIRLKRAEPTMSDNFDPNSIRKVVSVQAPPLVAWQVFAEKMGTWWPLAVYKIGKANAVNAVIEPYVGGRSSASFVRRRTRRLRNGHTAKGKWFPRSCPIPTPRPSKSHCGRRCSCWPN